jgi:hypothetical protein
MAVVLGQALVPVVVLEEVPAAVVASVEVVAVVAFEKLHYIYEPKT